MGEPLHDLESVDRDRLENALWRIAEPKAFFVATHHVDPEAYARMIYAELVAGGASLEEAEKETERKTRERYAHLLSGLMG